MSTTAQYTTKDIARFYSKVSTIPTEQGCLEWMAYHNALGYGRFWVGNDKNRSAHRVAWEIVNGPIPNGMMIRHFVCNNPRCCNVEHLRLGTYADNTQDMMRSGRCKNAPNTTTPYVRPAGPTESERFYAMVSKTPTETGCLEWLGYCNPKGYGIHKMMQKRWLAHRAVWTLANGPIPDGMVIAHHCDNPRCCRIEHLFCCTQIDNIHDMNTKGRNSPPPIFLGEKCLLAKLTAEQVLEIRSDKWAGRTQSEIAAHFDITPGTVSKILLCNAWTHLDATQDAQYESGTVKGERHYHAKLTAAQVLEIRSDKWAGRPLREISTHFGITKGGVSNILHNRTWTHLDPTQDVPHENRQVRGEQHPAAKLTEQDVLAMRSDLYVGWKHIDIARHFGISEGQVSNILLRKTWKHI